MTHEERIDSAIDALEASRVDGESLPGDVLLLLDNLKHYCESQGFAVLGSWNIAANKEASCENTL